MAPTGAVQAPSGTEPAIHLLAVLPQHGAKRFVLQLLLDRAPDYQRSEQSGVVSLRLAHLRLDDGGPREGRVERDGRSLRWSLAALDDGAEPPAPDDYPVAAPRARPGPGAHPAQPAPAPRAVLRPQVDIASHRPDPLSQARQALLAGERTRAVALLEELHRRQPNDAEVLRWLARAWLADGHGERLLAGLPAQLRRFPAHSQLRLLLFSLFIASHSLFHFCNNYQLHDSHDHKFQNQPTL